MVGKDSKGLVVAWKLEVDNCIVSQGKGNSHLLSLLY